MAGGEFGSCIFSSRIFGGDSLFLVVSLDYIPICHVRFEGKFLLLMARLGHGVYFLCIFWRKVFIFDSRFGLRTVVFVYALK